jgi:osmotically-inducible protein OsmY
MNGMALFSLQKHLVLIVALGALCALLQACSPAATLLGAGARTGLALAEDRPVEEIWGDTNLKVTINQRLLETSFSDTFWSLNTTIFEGRVLLTGSVKTADLRDQVNQIVWGIDGVREVLNEIIIGQPTEVTQVVRDTLIKTSLQAKLLGDTIISDINYKIIAHDSVLYVIGVARHKAELDKFVQHARTVGYVKRFVNYVWLANNPSRSR